MRTLPSSTLVSPLPSMAAASTHSRRQGEFSVRRTGRHSPLASRRSYARRAAHLPLGRRQCAFSPSCPCCRLIDMVHFDLSTRCSARVARSCPFLRPVSLSVPSSTHIRRASGRRAPTFCPHRL
ncbi:hypothetical protein PLICRDRAFT_547109 [Plicaturopsis crispa FD-325 SS-3]|nr:hypothetical protein PLICRDRAFT_547109 [Plicaturopsis crispa FD-325 SS-3]